MRCLWAEELTVLFGSPDSQNRRCRLLSFASEAQEGMQLSYHTARNVGLGRVSVCILGGGGRVCVHLALSLAGSSILGNSLFLRRMSLNLFMVAECVDRSEEEGRTLKRKL